MLRSVPLLHSKERRRRMLWNICSVKWIEVYVAISSTFQVSFTLRRISICVHSNFHFSRAFAIHGSRGDAYKIDFTTSYFPLTSFAKCTKEDNKQDLLYSSRTRMNSNRYSCGNANREKIHGLLMFVLKLNIYIYLPQVSYIYFPDRF